VSEETVALLKRRATENRLWGAERIRGARLKRGMRVSTRTVQRHMRAARPPCPRRQTWATFLHHHAQDVWACAFLPVIDVGVRALVAFVIVDRASRRVVHVGVTRHPTDAWVAPHLRETTPVGAGPRFLILHENQLHRVLRAYCAYVNTARPHQGIGQAIPEATGHVGTRHPAGPVVSLPILGGLHHDYRRAA